MTETLSKNQQKRHLKQERWLQNRAEKRKLEKEKKKAKRVAEAIEREKLGLTLEAKRKRIPMSESENKFRVVIDMDFEDFMTEHELGKSAKQVGRIYSCNRQSEKPCQLYITSVKGKIKDQMDKTNKGFVNWDANVSELDYLKVFDQNNETKCDTTEYKSQFIYLTGDSANTLPDTDELLKNESTIFIIGGLVDHNRHKDLCHKRASSLGLRTAKLPLKEHIKLNQRHILSTFAVFEILLHVLASRKPWPEALALAIPKRKVEPTNDSPTGEHNHNRGPSQDSFNSGTIVSS